MIIEKRKRIKQEQYIVENIFIMNESDHFSSTVIIRIMEIWDRKIEIGFAIESSTGLVMSVMFKIIIM